MNMTVYRRRTAGPETYQELYNHKGPFYKDVGEAMHVDLANYRTM